MEKLKRVLNSFESPRILDVGTGTGAFIGMIKQMYDGYEQIVGIDLLERAITAAKENFKEDERVEFKVMDINKMEYEEKYFDIVILSNTLHHLSDIKKTMEQMEKYVKTGGIILINEMVSNDLNKAQLSHKYVHHFAAEVDRTFGDFHKDTFTNIEILQILKDTSTFQIKDAWDFQGSSHNEPTDELIEFFQNTLDRLIAKSKEEDKKYFEKKAVKVIKHIKTHGFESATPLVVVLAR